MVISFVNAKGGVGKTTLSVSYAVWLKEKGYSVAFIDADKQRLSSDWLKAVEPEVEQWQINEEQVMLDRIVEVRDNVDFLIVDGPAGDSSLTRVILLRSDIAFLPCGPSELDLKGTQDEIKVVKSVQDIREGKPSAYFIPNRVKPDQILTRELFDIGDGLGIPFTKNYLKQRDPYADAPGQQTVVWRMGWLRRQAGNEMKNLFEEIVGYDNTTETRKLVGNE